MKSNRAMAFINGWASAFDLSGNFFINSTENVPGPQRDGEALKGDWQAVGRDIRHGIDQFTAEHDYTYGI